MKFQKMQLDHKAIEYIKTILKEMKMDVFFDIKNLNEGSVFTYLPLNVGKNLVNKFDHGGIVKVPEKKIHVDGGYFVKVPDNAFKYLAEEIYIYINSDKNNICFQRSGWWKKDDKCVKEQINKFPLYFYNHYTYDFLLESYSRNKIRNFLDMDFRHTFGVMTKINKKMSFLTKDRQDISKEDMQFFIDHIQKLFVVAYDGEGFIIWEKSKHIPPTP